MGIDKADEKYRKRLDDSNSLDLSCAEACARSLAASASLETLKTNPGSAIKACKARGSFDSLALKKAHHSEQTHQQFAPEHALSRSLYDLIERERYEALGANQFVGVRQNLDARTDAIGVESLAGNGADLEWVRRSDSGVSSDSVAAIHVQLQALTALKCRCVFRDDEVGIDDRLAVPEVQHLVSTLNQTHFEQLASMLHDQYAFAGLASLLADRLTARMQAALGVNTELVASGEEPEDILLPSGSADDFELMESGTLEERDGTEESNVAADRQDEAVADASERALDEAPVAGPDPVIQFSGQRKAYEIFTTEFDETGHATQWADTEQLLRWRIELDRHIALHGKLVSRLAKRLQRVLLAQQKRHWQFDLDEGQLDTARLSRIISDPLMSLSFKAESDALFQNTALTLLIDNSRSMLGKPIMTAAVAADILARTLERFGVTVEILGFTTCHLHRGLSTQAWEQQGSPENPGRLNDLRHIIYKAADTPYRLARRNIGLMLDQDILKQNIDGEALSWAYKRLQRRPQQRRILMTLSDGAPVDTSTQGANSGDYLLRHLQSIIHDIEASSSVELMAIGIGHDVSDLYSRAVTVFEARHLGPVMLNQLESLFCQAA